MLAFFVFGAAAIVVVFFAGAGTAGARALSFFPFFTAAVVASPAEVEVDADRAKADAFLANFPFLTAERAVEDDGVVAVSLAERR